MRRFRRVAVFGILGLLLGCGGGSGSSGGGGGGGGGGTPGCSNGTAPSPSGNPIATAAANVAPITVDGGLPGTSYVNGVFVTVTVCVHGTSTCQAIDHVLVDTGSYGLRLLSNAGGGALSSALSSALQPQKDTLGNSIAECAQFSDGITWGPVKQADILISGETASSVQSSNFPGVAVQIIGDPAFATVPTACTKFGSPEDTLSKLLANGIVGVGPFPQDCGGGCTLPGTDPGNPGVYYACPPSGCTSTTTPTSEAVANQVQNPVSVFSILQGSTVADNNGVIMELPGVPASGTATVNGMLVFGIGTKPNNGLGNATQYTGDPSTANITTTFGGTPYSNSFVDSGSNGFFFPSNIQTCSANSGFYCPASNLTCSAMNAGTNSKQSTVDFNIQNLDMLPGGSNAFNDIGGPNNPPPGSNTSAGFDWGLPFFFGRNVYTGMEQTDALGNVTQPPYYAY